MVFLWFSYGFPISFPWFSLRQFPVATFDTDSLRLSVAAVGQVHLVVAHHTAVLQGHLATMAMEGGTQKMSFKKNAYYRYNIYI